MYIYIYIYTYMCIYIYLYITFPRIRPTILLILCCMGRYILYTSAAKALACLPVHMLIACLQFPQPCHLTTYLHFHMLYTIAQERPFDTHLAQILDPWRSNMPESPFNTHGRLQTAAESASLFGPRVLFGPWARPISIMAEHMGIKGNQKPIDKQYITR